MLVNDGYCQRVYEVDDEDDNAETVNDIESGDALLFGVKCLSENEDEEMPGIKKNLFLSMEVVCKLRL